MSAPVATAARPRAAVAAAVLLAVLWLGGALGPTAPAAARGGGPVLAAPAAILVEPASGETAFARQADRRRRMASTTKLMTVLVALEQAPLARTLTAVPYPAQAAESVLGLRPGERMTVADLVRAALLASANDAAATLAAGIGGSSPAFVRLMNRRARALGMSRTHFANPVGLDEPGEFSTPRDLAKLAVAVRRIAFARVVMDRASAVLHSGDRTRRIANRNTLVRDVRWVSGVKTGHTQQAGYILVGSGSRHGVELVSVVMGDPTEGQRNYDTLSLLTWGFARYRRVTAVRAGQVVTTVPVRDQDTAAKLVPARAVRIVARRGERVTTVALGVPSELEGPVDRGAAVATLAVRRGSRTVATVPLVVRDAIARASFWQRNSWIKGTLAALVLVAVVGGAADSLTGANRRRRRRRAARSETA